MENPYWQTDGWCHYVELEEIKLICLELTNFCYASVALAKEFEYRELEDEKELSLDEFSLFKIHHEYAFKKISSLTLSLAMLSRTYDDIMKDLNVSGYKDHIIDVDDHSNIGHFEGIENFSIREAFNKLLHAKAIRPLYKRYDRSPENPSLIQDIWYLTGEVELKGEHQGKDWEAHIYLQPFIEAVLHFISFGYPNFEESNNGYEADL